MSNFMWNLELLNWRTKVCSKGPGHMTKMAAMPMYDKSLKNLLLRNQKADDLETWYGAFGVDLFLRRCVNAISGKIRTLYISILSSHFCVTRAVFKQSDLPFMRFKMDLSNL